MHALLYYVVPAVIFLVGIRKYRESKWKMCTNTVKLTGKIAIVTGANSGIGYEIAKELCKRGAEVIFACRNKDAATKAIAKIDREVESKVTKVFEELDLSSIHSIKTFAEKIKLRYQKIDILINNAGVSYNDDAGIRTKDGIEVHFGVNHLGHFLLTNLLLENLENAKPSRVIIVSSRLHQNGKIDFDNFTLRNPKAVKNLYANSKLANFYFCKGLTNKMAGKGVGVYCVCPGWVLTSLFRHHIRKLILSFVFVLPAAFFFMRSPKQGAQTAIFCATDPSVSNESGYFYRDCRKYRSTVEFDENISERLWNESVKLINEKEAGINLSQY